jgi:tetratricopeptide (TPR) repeat protein
MKTTTALATLVALAMLGKAAYAGQTLDAAIADLQHQWAVINYQTPEDAREAKLKALADQAEAVSQQYPNQAAALAWHAIILSTYAKAKGGLGALDPAEQARDLLLQAAKIDEKALGGGIDSSLGALYHKVPGWPIGFGNDKKAKDYFLKALALNPNGIDENYFYGDFLLDAGEKEEARKYLTKALNAPARTGREDADAGRKQEIQGDLAKIDG